MGEFNITKWFKNQYLQESQLSETEGSTGLETSWQDLAYSFKDEEDMTLAGYIDRILTDEFNMDGEVDDAYDKRDDIIAELFSDFDSKLQKAFSRLK